MRSFKDRFPFKRSGLNFNKKRGRRDLKKFRFGLLLVGEILFSIGLGAIVAYMFFCSVFVRGVSMEPVLNSGDRILINRVSSFFSPKRGDVVAFNSGSGHNKSVNVKRIVGIPGDTILIEGGTLYINGKKEELSANLSPINEPGIAKSPIELSEGEYFLLGDNRNNSEDSRYESLGTVSKKELLGTAWFCVTLKNLGPM